MGAVAGATFGVGPVLFGAPVAAISIENAAIGMVAGPLSAAAGIVFKGLTDQSVGPGDAIGAFTNMIPLPEDKWWLSIPFGVAMDQIANVLSALTSQAAPDTTGPQGGAKSRVLR